MKRDDITKIFEGATDDQISALLDINSKDIGKAKGDTEALNTTIADLKGKLDKATGLVKEFEAAKANAPDVDTMQKTIADQKVQIVGFQNLATVASAGIDPRFHKFVVSEVATNVTEDKDFKAALDEYVKANPQFAAQAQPQGAWGKQQTANPGDKPTKTMGETISERMFPHKE